MNKKDELLTWLIEEMNNNDRGFTADEVAEKAHLSRSVISRYFNQLVVEKKLEKKDGRPVRFKLVNQSITESEKVAFDLIGSNGSLKKAVKQAQAAVLYPPSGLHTLIYGETGVGKSYFAREMYQYALSSGRISSTSPFVVLNCADYADNPQLLMGEIFGVKKGAYTGADKDREGLLQKANGGMLFLDEVHRLPPQGQEMLFTFMDYGHFRSLGSNQDITGVTVQIIAATTENPESVLLSTFKRRIPIFIELPSLSQRTIEERKLLIQMFLKQEALRIHKPIAISRHAFISLLLYECKNNIGQLRTDIQQACAKAFLHYVSHDEVYLKVRSIDLTPEVKAGYNLYKGKRQIVDQLLPPSEETLLTDQEMQKSEKRLEPSDSENFYSDIEEKVLELKRQGADEETVRQVISADIDLRFSKYLQSMKGKSTDSLIEKVVDPVLIELSHKLMNIESERLKREISPSLKAAFTLHMASAIERIQNHQPIFNPKLNQIRVTHMEEFIIAMDLAREIELALGMILPIDEIGFITMFLLDHESEEQNPQLDSVSLFVLMHGKSTASSMAEVVNELIGDSQVIAFDMPLSMPVEEMYRKVSDYIEAHNIKQVLLMVDMGSLSNFGEMLYEDFGIATRTLTQCSTPLVLEVARKVTTGMTLEEIYRSLDKGYMPSRSMVRHEIGTDKLLILTACFTGEGTAERMKRILEKRLSKYPTVQIVSIDLADRSKYLATIDYYKSHYRLIAITSTLNIPIEQVPVFSAYDLLHEESLKQMEHIVEEALLLEDISKSIQETVEYPSYELVKVASEFIESVEKSLGKVLQADARVGFLLHVVFYIDNKLKGKILKPFEAYRTFLLDHGPVYDKLTASFQLLESAFAIEIPVEQRAFLCKVILSNLDQ